MTRKLCVKCRLHLPIVDFHGDRSRPDGRYPYCRPCCRKQSAQYRQKSDSPEKRAKARRRALQSLWRREGIVCTLDDYDKLFQRQNGLCAICQQRESIQNRDGLGPLRVDHHHETGRVRALLCHRCNVALGLMQEDAERLETAARYLRSF